MKPVRVVVIDRNDITRKGVEGIVSDAGDPFQVLLRWSICVRLKHVSRKRRWRSSFWMTRRFIPVK